MSECYCDDGDPPIFYRKADVARARDLYTCCECGRAILPGESYERVHAMWDRYEGPRTIHTCAWCVHLREWMVAHVPCFCLLHEGLLPMVQDELTANLEADVLRPEVEAMLAEIHARPTRKQYEELPVRD